MFDLIDWMIPIHECIFYLEIEIPNDELALSNTILMMSF